MWTCPVCDAKNDTPVCTNCGFDSSCDYAHHPTLQRPTILPDAISILREQRNAPAAPSVAGTLTAIRSQGWEPHVLSAVEKILNAAAEGNLTEQHRVEIFLDVTNADYSLPKKETIFFSPEHIQLSSFCKICGASNGATAPYCNNCGSRIPDRIAEAPISQAVPVRQQPHLWGLSILCDYCGAVLTPGSIYCTECDRKVK